MKVTTVLNVSADYLFTRLVEPLLFDIEHQTNQQVSVEQLQGFSYTASLVNDSTATITFTKVQPSKTLHYRYATVDTTICVVYDLQFVAADKVRVSYRETVQQSRKKATRLFSWLSDEVKMHNFKKQLKFFEAGY